MADFHNQICDKLTDRTDNYSFIECLPIGGFFICTRITFILKKDVEMFRVLKRFEDRLSDRPFLTRSCFVWQISSAGG